MLIFFLDKTQTREGSKTGQDIGRRGIKERGRTMGRKIGQRKIGGHRDGSVGR